jgi:hypothetical protein
MADFGMGIKRRVTLRPQGITGLAMIPTGLTEVIIAYTHDGDMNLVASSTSTTSF